MNTETQKLVASYRAFLAVVDECRELANDDPHSALDRVLEHSEGARAALAEFDRAQLAFEENGADDINLVDLATFTEEGGTCAH